MTLKELRNAAGLSQKELAERVGVPFQTVQRYERKDCQVSNMTLGMAQQFAQALGVTLEELAKN